MLILSFVGITPIQLYCIIILSTCKNISGPEPQWNLAALHHQPPPLDGLVRKFKESQLPGPNSQILLPNSCTGIYFFDLMLSNFGFDIKKSTTSPQKSCQKTIQL